MREIQAGDLTVRGTSTAGVNTSLHIPQLKVVLDAGIAHPSFAKEEFIFLSHCHMDHVGSLMALLGHRELKRLSAATVFVPTEVQGQVKSLVDTAVSMGKFNEHPQVLGLENCTYSLPNRTLVSAINTHHAVPSNGYVFTELRFKLKPEYQGLEGQELGKLRKQGVEITTPLPWPRLAYITDTTSDVWDTSPSVFKADVLVMECTFLDDEKPISSAKEHGHIHIDEIVNNADRFENKHVVLMHFSARYDNDEIRRIVDDKIPADLRERMQLLLPED